MQNQSSQTLQFLAFANIYVAVHRAQIFEKGGVKFYSIYFLPILVEFSLGKGMLFGNFGQRTVKVR